ncbi:eaa protein [Raoultella sp. C349492]|uniref:eaa protein n=1 Tax=Raoultella sp. C349492 TaxID=2970253 RepID=UPI0035C72B0C
MSDVKEKIMRVMTENAAQQEINLRGKYPFRMATWNIRSALEKRFPEETWKCAEIRKVLAELAREGLVTKDMLYSRIGQAVWRLEVKS